jgi:serine/threonine protein kinase
VSLSAKLMSNRIGQVISDRYVLAELIGSGGHSNVFRAIDRSGGPNVAVKILQDELAGSEEHVVRLVREHRVMTLLAGTAAVRVRGLATSPDGAVCLVMELLRGKDLDGVLAEVETGGGRMAVDRVLHLLGPVVVTLERAHEQGIVHRDVKPGNIYVMQDGDEPGVRLIDFMLARLERARPLTRKGMIIGSPSYIAPEAWAGDPRATDHRMDVYSFGAIVFRLLGGRVPFDAPTLKEKIELITHGPRPSLHALRPELPRDVDRWVEDVLTADPRRRFQRVEAAWASLLETVTPSSAAQDLPA